MTRSPVVAIVLAAGESRRMGTLKPLLPYGSGSVIQAVVRSLKASPAGPVLVVLGHRSDEIRSHLAGEGVEFVFNPRYREGMLTSVQAGAAAAPADTEWLVVALADQPSLQPSTVVQLLSAARSSRSTIAGRREGWSPSAIRNEPVSGGAAETPAWTEVSMPSR